MKVKASCGHCGNVKFGGLRAAASYAYSTHAGSRYVLPSFVFILSARQGSQCVEQIHKYVDKQWGTCRVLKIKTKLWSAHLLLT